MNKIQTAKEFYDMHDSDDCVVMMREFAKLHVEAALKQATECAEVNVLNYNDYEVDKKSILNSYPLENIK
jgi:hypothetical protein